MSHPSPPESRPEIILDISRLLSRILHATPTGVDRVEMAYARQLLVLAPERLSFAAVHPTGLYGRLARDAVLAFLDRVEDAWDGKRSLPRKGPRRWLHLVATLFALRPRRIPRAERRRILVQTSPHHLHREQMVRAILHRERAAFACFVHDLIPIEYPEYARPGGAALHRRRIETIARHADLAIANSEATRVSFLAHTRSYDPAAIMVAPLGIDRVALSAPSPAREDRPYFICIGTIEPRKNHLLLLQIWRDLSLRLGSAAVPRLLVVGRRGWENEQVLDLLDRCPALTDCVQELNGLADQRVRQLLHGARALLLPSFAEGYGMPVVEALDAGVPVICSDLAALREAGGGVPDYLDPIDGAAWTRAILGYADLGSPARAAQLSRLERWAAPEWHDHVAAVGAMIDQTAIRR